MWVAYDSSADSLTTSHVSARKGWHWLATCPCGSRLAASAGRYKHGMLQVRQAPRSAPHCPVVSLTLVCSACASGPADPNSRAGGADLLLPLAAGLGRPREVPEDGPAK